MAHVFHRSARLDSTRLHQRFERLAGNAALLGSSLLVCAAPLGAQCLSMQYVAQSRQAGNAVSAIVSGDIDGDGDVDVLTADTSASLVRVLVNQGSGTFAPHAFAPGIAVTVLALGDVDEDGDLDLAVASSSALRWLSNDGSGQFAAVATYAFGAGDSNAVALQLADLDIDGHLDAVATLNVHPIASGFSGGAWVARGDGLGGFTPLPTHELLLRASESLLADFNGDGRLDLVYTGSSASAIAMGVGDGSFANSAAVFSIGIYAGGLAAGDFDADGDVDLATGFKYFLSVRRNDGTGAFTLAQQLGVGAYVKGAVAGDLDGDGDLDLMSTSGGSSAITLLSNDSAGHFQFQSSVPAAIQCSSVLLADTSGDGYLDAWAGDVTNGHLFSAVSNCQSTCGGSSTYCTAAPNSTGAGASIAYLGSRSIQANALTLTCDRLPPGSHGIFYLGTSTANVAFGNGYRCVGNGVQRLLPALTASANGGVSRPLDFTLPPLAGTIAPGSTRYFQYWYRDAAAGGASFNLSEGLSVTFCN